MAKNQGQRNSDEDILVYIIVGIILLLGLSFVLSYYQGSINYWFSRIKIYETFPYMWWDKSWATVSNQILDGTRDISQTPLSALAKFYNKGAAFFWFPIFAFCIWKVWKRPTKDSCRTLHTPQSLLATVTKIFSTAAPWVHRDLTKVNWNYGTWRLMESPLMFLIRNKAILDPNGEPFHWNVAYECGDTEKLYVQIKDSKRGPISKEDEINESSFDTGMAAARADELAQDGKKLELPSGTFQLPVRMNEGEKEEIEKFKKASLVPDLSSPYLNTKKRKVLNTLDERRLRTALFSQVGERLDQENPFGALEKYLHDPKNRWRYSLALALFLHGFSDKTKSDAEKIFDAMNYSFFDDKPLVPERINIGNTMKLKFKNKDKRLFDQRFQNMCMPHATFMNPFFMSLLSYARTRGVVPSAWFGWLRGFDRTLWYAMSQTGRSVACVEACGAWSHFYAEEAVGQLDMPYVDMAVEGIRDEMVIEGWLNKTHEEELRDKKRKIDNKNEFREKEQENSAFNSEDIPLGDKRRNSILGRESINQAGRANRQPRYPRKER